PAGDGGFHEMPGLVPTAAQQPGAAQDVGLEQDIDGLPLKGDGAAGARQGPGDADPTDAMVGAGDPGDLSVEPSPKAAGIEMPPAPGGDMIIDRGPATRFGTAEGRVASMGEPDVDALRVGVEGAGIDPPGARQGQEPGEEMGVEQGRAGGEGRGGQDTRRNRLRGFSPRIRPEREGGRGVAGAAWGSCWSGPPA